VTYARTRVAYVANGNFGYDANVMQATSKQEYVMRSLWVMMALISLCACQRVAETPVLGTLERDRLELVAEAHEPIAELLVHEGDHVVAGQPLLRQTAGAMQPRLEQSRALLDKAEQQLSELQRGPRAQEIAQARAALDAANSSLTNAIREYERALKLQQSNLLSASALDQARTARDAAQGVRDEARAALQLLNEGTRAEQIAQAKSAAQAARASLAELQLSATRYTLTAPRAGIIEAIPYKLGERPASAAPLVVMLADDRLYARVYVPEPLRSRYVAGTKVQLHVDGYDKMFAGQIRYISAQAAFTPYYALTQQDRSRLSYLAEIDISDGADLPVGLPVQVSLPATTP
jgi:HlyD family secretion protein